MSTILKLDNIIPDDLCDACIKFYKRSETHDMKEIYNNHVSAYSTYVNAMERDLEVAIHSALTKFIQAYIDFCPTYKPHSHTGYHIRKVYGATDMHWDNVFDGVSSAVRNLSIIAGLNSDFEEGVFNFPQQNYQTRLLRGQAIAFPVYFTHPHEVSSPKGYRYTINTWATEPPRPFIPDLQERM